MSENEVIISILTAAQATAAATIRNPWIKAAVVAALGAEIALLSKNAAAIQKPPSIDRPR